MMMGVVVRQEVIESLLESLKRVSSEDGLKETHWQFEVLIFER
jgi:hypothetical protein